jgi:hypothetical protein
MTSINTKPIVKNVRKGLNTKNISQINCIKILKTINSVEIKTYFTAFFVTYIKPLIKTVLMNKTNSCRIKIRDLFSYLLNKSQTFLHLMQAFI